MTLVFFLNVSLKMSELAWLFGVQCSEPPLSTELLQVSLQLSRLIAEGFVLFIDIIYILLAAIGYA